MERPNQIVWCVPRVPSSVEVSIGFAVPGFVVPGVGALGQAFVFAVASQAVAASLLHPQIDFADNHGIPWGIVEYLAHVAVAVEQPVALGDSGVLAAVDNVVPQLAVDTLVDCLERAVQPLKQSVESAELEQIALQDFETPEEVWDFVLCPGSPQAEAWGEQELLS